MMLPTHALGGMALALPLAAVAPEFSGVALVAGLLGGVVPDLDMYVGHRKSLHYPVYYPALAAPALAVAGLVRTTAAVAVAWFLVGAAAHSVADIFGGGLELRPWEATSDRGVYDHHRGRWIVPRRWIRYDGSPGDLLLSVALAAALLLALDGPLDRVVVVAVVVAVAYAAVRRRLPALADALGGVLVPRLPDRVRVYVPTRYRESGRRGASEG